MSDRKTVKFPHCVYLGDRNGTDSTLYHSVEKREILSHQKNISWNQLFSNYFSKNVAFTEFSKKSARVNFCNFHTVEWTPYRQSDNTDRISLVSVILGRIRFRINQIESRHLSNLLLQNRYILYHSFRL